MDQRAGQIVDRVERAHAGDEIIALAAAQWLLLAKALGRFGARYRAAGSLEGCGEVAVIVTHDERAAG